MLIDAQGQTRIRTRRRTTSNQMRALCLIGESKKQQRRYYWTMALLNLLETGAAAGVSKFTPLFLAGRGVDVAEVGVVLAIAQVCPIPRRLLVASAASRTRRGGSGEPDYGRIFSVRCPSARRTTFPRHASWRVADVERVGGFALLTDGYAFC